MQANRTARSSHPEHQRGRHARVVGGRGADTITVKSLDKAFRATSSSSGTDTVDLDGNANYNSFLSSLYFGTADNISIDGTRPPLRRDVEVVAKTFSVTAS